MPSIETEVRIGNVRVPSTRVAPRRRSPSPANCSSGSTSCCGSRSTTTSSVAAAALDAPTRKFIPSPRRLCSPRAPERYELAHAELVSVRDQDQRGVPVAVPTDTPGGLHQLVYLARSEVLPVSQLTVPSAARRGRSALLFLHVPPTPCTRDGRKGSE